MNDDTTEKTVDRNRAGARERDQLRYWSDKWGVSEASIRQAVERVGPMIKDVAHELGKA
jgi:hypothetical protein